MSAHVLLDLLNELKKRDKMRFRRTHQYLPSFMQFYNESHNVTLLNL